MKDQIHFVLWNRDPSEISPIPLLGIHLSNGYVMDCLVDYWNILRILHQRELEGGQ